VVFLAVLLTVLDLLVEGGDGWLPDLAVDFLDRLLLIGTAVIASILVPRLFRLETRTDDLALLLERASREGEAWRAQSRRFIRGLGAAIEAQFGTWGLTPAEADVAGLLLKGASVREIAILRRTSEATIRQQAQNVYRKSGLASRAELSAYFLEDLFSLSEAAMATRPDFGQRPDA
jgi:DNA-binding CsgD family transcriptional regulator